LDTGVSQVQDISLCVWHGLNNMLHYYTTGINYSKRHKSGINEQIVLLSGIFFFFFAVDAVHND